MESRIEHGVTIISTGDSKGGQKNKTGFQGVTYYESNNKFRSEIMVKRKKFLLGFFEGRQDAINARLVAEKKKEEGVLEEWITEKPHGNSDKFMPFWRDLFEKFGLK